MEVARVPVVGKDGLALRECYGTRRFRSGGKLCIRDAEADAVMKVVFHGVLLVCSDALAIDHCVVGFRIEVLGISGMPPVFKGNNVVFLVVCGVFVRESVLGNLLLLERRRVA